MRSAHTDPSGHSLFSVFGIEIEYAVVKKDSLEVVASVDKLIETLAGSPDEHPHFGNVEIDNELAAHVLELKCAQPATDWNLQARDFVASVKAINRTLAKWNTMLMPGGMHPFMNPITDSVLWSHEDNSIYSAYDRIFGCRGHGWFNIQSVHLNLPFAGDAEFSQLHNSISLLLPFLPALAASSPIFDGKQSPWLDGRIFHYVNNQKRLPSIMGNIIPEPIGSEEEYREKILAPMFKEIAPLDLDGLLQEEWLNSRAAIARFDRSAIEIRCMDTQENPTADLALCEWVTSVLRHMQVTGADWLQVHRAVPTGLLRELFLETARVGMTARVPEVFPMEAFGVSWEKLLRGKVLRENLESGGKTTATVKDVTVRDFLLELSSVVFGEGKLSSSINLIFTQGNLAERILMRSQKGESDMQIFHKVCECLNANLPYSAH